MAYTLRTGPFVQTVGNFDTLAELNSGHPATLYNPGTHAFTVDNGAVYSDGTTWRSYSMQTASGGARVLAQGAVPIQLVSSGNMGNNGALTAITALPITYSNGIWMNFPAGAIAAGVPAAATTYWVVMSSTTAGTVFNNILSGVPNAASIPASPTAFVTTGPGAYTQTTASNVSVTSFVVPASTLGLNGRISFRWIQGHNNSAGGKNSQLQFGGTSVGLISATTSVQNNAVKDVYNRGFANSQIQIAGTGFGAAQANPQVMNNDSTTALTVNFQLQLVAAATDFVQFDAFSVEVYPG